MTKDVVKQKYEVVEKIGSGTFASVKKCRLRGSDELYAIKVITKTADNRHNLQREIEIMQKLNHPSIIKYKEMFDTPEKLYVIMELAEGGELFDRVVALKRLEEEEVRACVHQCASALYYLHHTVGIAHRDLKLENILYGDKAQTKFKISDFGLSSTIPPAGSTSLMKTCCGTPEYVAPEVLLNKGYDERADAWSLGVIMFTLLHGYTPFRLKPVETPASNNTESEPKSAEATAEENQHKSLQQLFRDIIKARYKIDEEIVTNPHAQDLIRQFLTPDPSRRITVENVLRHPFVSDSYPSPSSLYRVGPVVEVQTSPLSVASSSSASSADTPSSASLVSPPANPLLLIISSEST